MVTANAMPLGRYSLAKISPEGAEVLIMICISRWVVLVNNDNQSIINQINQINFIVF